MVAGPVARQPNESGQFYVHASKNDAGPVEV